MSSSPDEPLCWEDFAERPELDADVAVRAPAAELAAVLQRYRNDLDVAAAAAGDARRQVLTALAEQAVLAVDLERALARYDEQLAATLPDARRHLRVVKDAMLDAIAAAGLEVVRLEGVAASDVLDIADVDGWRHTAGCTAEIVDEEREPAVLADGEVLRRGRVVMGAPLAALDASQPVPPAAGEHGGDDTAPPDRSAIT